VAAVCHGPAIFPGIIDNETGKSIVHGKSITGFTREAEYTMDVMKFLNSWDRPLVDDWAEQLGAKCECIFPKPSFSVLTVADVRGAGVWDDYHVKENRLITGQNPQSAASTAYAALHTFEGL
jgi:D-lactate dehydratase